MTQAQSGIYQIRNTANGKVYVGSTQRFNKRWGQHKSRLRKGTHHSRHLQSAWTKHGEAAFVFEPIITCAPSMLIWYEQQFLEQMTPAYNVSSVAGSCRGILRTNEQKVKISATLSGRKHSLERIANIRAGHTYSAEWREKLRSAKLGTKQSVSTCEKKRQAMLGRTFSADSLRKMSEAQKGRAFSDVSRQRMSEGQRNKESLTRYTYNGETLSLSEWAKRVGLTVAGLYGRLHRRGWGVEKALTTPVGRW